MVSAATPTPRVTHSFSETESGVSTVEVPTLLAVVAYRPSKRRGRDTPKHVAGETMIAVSCGDWLACGECSDLIELGDYPTRARSAFRAAGLDLVVRGGKPGLRVRLLGMLSSSHRRFREARCGPRQRFENRPRRAAA